MVDSGLMCDAATRRRFKHLESCTDWTKPEGSAADRVGHGTFVAGMVGSGSSSCGGVAPGVELHVRCVGAARKAH